MWNPAQRKPDPALLLQELAELRGQLALIRARIEALTEAHAEQQPSRRDNVVSIRSCRPRAAAAAA